MPGYRDDLKPVFIVGAPRSGTTLLYRTLLKHPSFKLRKLCLEETKIFLKPDIAQISSHKPAPLFNYMLNDKNAYQDFLASIKLEKKWQLALYKSGLYHFLSDKPVFWRFSLNKRVIRKYFYYARQARGGKRIVEKTPRHLLEYNRILHSFPNAKIIVTLRHPVDVFSSYIRRKKRDPGSDWLNITLSEFIKRYREMSVNAIELSESDEAICVKYEKFVRNPENEFKQICMHLDEPFIPELLSEGEKSLADYKADPFLAKPITQKTKNWSDFLNIDQVIAIENSLADEMKKFGYRSKLNDSL
jgi:hypothetical protein